MSSFTFKQTVFTILSLIASISVSHAESIDLISKVLDSNSLLEVIAPEKVSKAIYTPFAVRYIQNGNFSPSCTLINKDNIDNKLELISPENGNSFGNCASPINKPTTFSINENKFAVYFYLIEDPKTIFTKSYQLVKLLTDKFVVCQKDNEINAYIENHAKKQGVKFSAKTAINKFGCQPHD